MAKISVIVPVYNTENYIEKCLESLIHQTRKEEIEIIVVNDGSTDHSEEKIKKYEKHIKYYAKENEGIAKTRNFGIEKATSEYVMFVDADDYVDTTLVEKLEPYLDKQIDLIKFKLQKVDGKGKLLERIEGPVFETITGEEAFDRLYSEDVLLDSPCVYIIKKELFTKNHFQFQQRYHEDFGLIPLLILVAKSVVSTNYYLYSYVQVENSITRNEDYEKTLKRMEDVLLHYDNMIETIGKLELRESSKENIKIYYTNAILLKLKDLKGKDQKYYIQQVQKRNFAKNIKARNIKQLIKKLLLKINIKLYLKLR